MSAEIYAVKPSSHPETFAFTKFDNDLNPLTSYLVSRGECNCPRGETGRTCRHRDMLPGFIKTKHVGDGWMFNYSTRQWIRPTPAQQEVVDETHEDGRPEWKGKQAQGPHPLPAEKTGSAGAPAPEPQVLASAPVSPAVSGAGVTSFQKRRF